ncbi:MAG: pyridoxamine 5'-phosphate oxidase family protein [Lactobacillus sp.]|jgi:nitroimidazol reductase NimA-like FMN-containing flavoprotein (pyridoxamine 5'-phosphate oxidase superfamily)|nr:MAG: pyridoxamine 5'-phosphate oxidase family protein [Lactobacillus sp.]
MRRTDREVTDIDEIKSILRECHIINSGFRTDDYPYVVPTNYGYEFNDEQLVLYIHGAPVGYKRKLIAADSRMGFAIHDAGKLMMPKDPSKNTPSMAYQSVMGYGDAELIDDLDAKKHALVQILKHEIGDQWKTVKITDKALQYVGVIKINVKKMTAKAHSANDAGFVS